MFLNQLVQPINKTSYLESLKLEIIILLKKGTRSCGQVTWQTLRTVDHRDELRPVQRDENKCWNHEIILHSVQLSEVRITNWYKLRMSMLKFVNNALCIVYFSARNSKKRFVVILSSCKSYNFTIVCKMIVGSKAKLFC